ncbi:MAG: hypothetical protein ACI9R3_003810 [Verrucomicrobiales bacterium]|jgi:hypothetical protein
MILISSQLSPDRRALTLHRLTALFCLIMWQLGSDCGGQTVTVEALQQEDSLIQRVKPSQDATSPPDLPIPGSDEKLKALGIRDLDELEDFETVGEPSELRPVGEMVHAPEEVPRNMRRRTLPSPQPPSLAEIEGAFDQSEADRDARTSIGKPTVEVSARTGATWDDNIFISASDKESDTIISTSVKTGVKAGNFNDAYASRAKVEYEPQAYVFIEHSEENSIDHDASFEVQYTANRLTGAASGSYRKTSGGNPDFGERVDAQVSDVELMIAYAFTARTRAELTGTFTDRRYDADYAFNSRELSGKLLADYEMSNKTHLAAGVSAGRLDVDGGGNQDFQRALLRLRSQITDKTTFDAEGGADFRQTEGGDMTTPVLALALQTTPQSGTDLGLRLTQEIQPSGALGGQNYVRTGIEAFAAQRLTDRFKFTLDAGYDRYSYESTAGGTAGTREDDFYIIRPGLRYQREHVHADLFYEYRKNTSSDSFSYDVNRVGVSLGTQF